MANRRPQQGGGGRRMEFMPRNDGRKSFGSNGLSPWQSGGPGMGLPQLLPMSGGSSEATLALASNILNLLQPRQNPVPSLLDMPIRRDFVPMGHFDRGYGQQRMGNQGNFRRTGNYNRAGVRMNNTRKPFKPNDGPRQPPKNFPKKEADSNAKPVKESPDSEPVESTEETPIITEVTEKGKKEPLKTRYDDISPQLLKCHICNKRMWDGRSFLNHLSGRAHGIMMQKTAESYALTADTMRQEVKIREMKRTRKSGPMQPPRNFYCAMCDIYAADGGVHRTTVAHRKLKKYLHPTCTSCHKEMPTRIELDEHRMTAEHLRNMQVKHEDEFKPKPGVMMICTLAMEQSYLRDDKHKRRGLDKQAESSVDNTHNTEDGVKKEAVTEEVELPRLPIDNENTVLDYQEDDDLSQVTSDMLPEYSTERGVGASFLTEYKCMMCKLCNKLLDCEETAQVHLRTRKHYQLFMKRLQPPQQQQESVGMKRAVDAEDDGNWKRRRVDTDGADDDEQDALAGEVIKAEQTEEQNEVSVEMPPQDELEDWEQSVDEILADERSDNQTEKKAADESALDEVGDAALVECAAPEPEPAAPVVASPRRRGGGRGRGRGRGQGSF